MAILSQNVIVLGFQGACRMAAALIASAKLQPF